MPTSQTPHLLPTQPSLAAMLQRRVEMTPELPAFSIRRGDVYHPILWREVGTRMEAIAAGLLTCGVVLDDGARVTLMGNAGVDWITCDFAALTLGLQTVPVYASLLPGEVAYMHADTGARVAIVDDAAQLEKLREAQRGITFRDKPIDASRILVEHVVVIHPEGIAASDDWESLADLEVRGKRTLADTKNERRRRTEAPGRSDLATFTYTSGTTGVPKAVLQSHGNMLTMLEQATALGMFRSGTIQYGLFLFLPPAHSFGRMVELAGPFLGAPLVMSSVPTLADDLGVSAPGFFPSAPRVFEKMKSKIEGAVETASPLRQRLFRWALDVGEQTIDYRADGRPLPLALAAQVAIARRLVWSKLQARLGLHRSDILLSGSAPLSPTVHRFFLSLGFDLMEAYGLTETCPGLTTNIPGCFRIGTVGKPFPQVTLHIAEDGEILAKGPNITAGYLNQPEATEASFRDGWFCTGDLGSIDDDGFLRITGRKKELIKTSGGKYVAPAKIEETIKRHRLVQEAVVIGDGHNYCVCLVALDDEELAEWKIRENVTGDVRAAASGEIDRHIQSVNATLASFETMKAFRLCDEMFSVENQLLTASLKVRRKPVQERYADLIAEMYA